MSNHDDLGFVADNADDHSDLGFVEEAPKASMLSGLMDKIKSAGQTALDGSIATANSASMNFLDEAAGATTAGLDALLSGAHNIGLADPSPSQARQELIDQGADVAPLSPYVEGREGARAQIAAAEDRSPIASTVGNLAGSVYSGMKTAGLASQIPGVSAAGGAIAGAASKLPGAAEVASLAAKYPTITKAATTGAKFAAMGAPEGALYGLGDSEGDLTKGRPQDYEKVVDDMVSNAMYGSLVGGGIGLASEVVPAAWRTGKDYFSKKASDVVEDSDLLGRMKAGFDYGTEGIDLTSKKERLYGKDGRAPLSRQNEDWASDIVGKMTDADSLITNQYGDVLKQATDRGVKVDAGTIINDIKSMAFDPVLKGELSRAPDVQTILMNQSGRVTPAEMQQLKRFVGDTVNTLSSATDGATQATGRKLQSLYGDIRSKMIKDVPGFAAVNEKLASYRGSVLDPILNRGKPEAYANKTYNSLSNADNKLVENIQKMIENSGKGGVSSGADKIQFNRLQQGLEEIKARGQSDVLKALGAEDIPKFMSDLEQKADKASALYAMNRYDSSGSHRSLLGAASEFVAGKDAGVGIGNKVGYYGTKGKKAVYDWPKDKLAMFADKLLTVPGTQANGQALKQALSTGDTAKKNAIIFSLLQNPSTRSEIENQEQE